LPEDKIVKIENESTYGITLEDAVKKLRGDPGTNVKITVAREGAKEPIDYTITREIIKIETLSSKMLNSEIGYIHLYEFNANGEIDLKTAITDLKTKGMKGLVFDLRNNPGGLLNIAIDVAKLFLSDRKMIVYTKGRISQSNREFYSGQTAPFENLPIVVLINGGSASASEIVSGALQDHKRALVIGTHSFGKASVQTVIPLDKGAGLRLTTAKYYTPSGRMIQRDDKGKGGIDPDIKIEVTPEIEMKLRQQEEKIYPPGKEPVSAKKEEVPGQ
jgi:carboxyl-terminal processing protease